MQSLWFTTKLFNTCDEQQFYITKIMMLIFSIIVMCSYLYSGYLLSRVLKNIYFKEHFLVVASKYSICDMENKTKESTLRSLEKAWFMSLMEIYPHNL